MLRQYAPVPGTATRSPRPTSPGRNSSRTTTSPLSQCLPTTRARTGWADAPGARGRGGRRGGAGGGGGDGVGGGGERGVFFVFFPSVFGDVAAPRAVVE